MGAGFAAFRVPDSSISGKCRVFPAFRARGSPRFFQGFQAPKRGRAPGSRSTTPELSLAPTLPVNLGDGHFRPCNAPECLNDSKSFTPAGQKSTSWDSSSGNRILHGSHRFRAALPPGPHVRPARGIGFQPCGAPSVLGQGPVQCPEPAGLGATSGRRCECLTGLCPRTAPQGAREEGDPFSRHLGSQLWTRETAAAHVLEAPGNLTRPGALTASRSTPWVVTALGSRLERECFPLGVRRSVAAG